MKETQRHDSAPPVEVVFFTRKTLNMGDLTGCAEAVDATLENVGERDFRLRARDPDASQNVIVWRSIDSAQPEELAFLAREALIVLLKFNVYSGITATIPAEMQPLAARFLRQLLVEFGGFVGFPESDDLEPLVVREDADDLLLLLE